METAVVHLMEFTRGDARKKVFFVGLCPKCDRRWQKCACAGKFIF